MSELGDGKDGALSAQLIERLTRLPSERITMSRLEMTLHSHDLAPVPPILKVNYNNMPTAVLKPETTEEVARIVAVADSLKTCLIPKGRGTSYLWGSVPVVGGVVVDMVEMNKIDDFSADGEWIEAGAGATWENVEKYLEKKGFSLRVYPTSMPVATLGGWIASSGSGLGSGGSGVGSVMYGPVGKNLAGLEVVTGMGEILNLSEPADIADFVGADGITGFITRVRLKIRKKPASVHRILITAPDAEGAQRLVEAMGAMKSVYFAQFEDASMLEIKTSLGLHAPLGVKGFLLFASLEGDAETVSSECDQLKEMASECGGKTLPETQAQKEWEERLYPMRVKRGGPTVIAGEFMAPSSRLASVLKDIYAEFPGGAAKHGIHGVVIEAPDVMLMPQVFSDERKGLRFLASLAYTKRFNDIGRRHGGQPYGVGHLNAFNAKTVHGKAGYDRLKALKKKYDPGDIINPGKGIEHRTRFGFAAPPFMYNLSMFGLGLFRRLGV